VKTRSFHDPENEDCPKNTYDPKIVATLVSADEIDEWGCTCEEPDFRVDFEDPSLMAQIDQCIEQESGTNFIWPSSKRASMFIKIRNLIVVAKRLGLHYEVLGKEK